MKQGKEKKEKHKGKLHTPNIMNVELILHRKIYVLIKL